MALDMYIGELHKEVGEQEGTFFRLISAQADEFPVWMWLRENIYDDPRISPQQANSLVHELIRLLDHQDIGNNNDAVHRILLLLSFFSKSYVSGQEIRCASD